DLETERRVQAAVRAAVSAGLVTAAHDCAEGGAAVALAEGCVTGRELVGRVAALPAEARAHLTLFREGPSRAGATRQAARAGEFDALMAVSAIPWRWLGTTGGQRLVIRIGARIVVDVDTAALAQGWRTGFERHVA